MIRGVHTMFYSSAAEELRAFLRDKLDLPATDVGGGWLIFDRPAAEMGVHPVDQGGSEAIPSGTPYISFYCDNLDETIRTLRGRGVEFEGGMTETSWGRRVLMRVPGGFTIELYEPRYAKE